ncbi:hypothetical protein [Geobacter anodireducens]|uniref:Bacterial repeat domain-containing protein n=1 Tax=Geobacter anodireducens TaxID=1340425 RepID=A0ABR9NSH5_9BACT|nr:hypothetical protein [Geobacter anodireducens]MBE2887217.1 hypothetical protein [Geobacter anodireducens]
MHHFKRLIFGITIAFTTSVSSFAATDGSYTLSKLDTVQWENIDANPLRAISSDYTYFYGDDEYLTYSLPNSWQFKFYGQPYSQITVDTNGNIWFGSARSAYSFPLANAGFGPVGALWNEDLSSLYGGGVFIEHLTAPERVVIQWQTETMTEEGAALQNSFEAVLFNNGTIRYDYKPFTAANATDTGSGISKDAGTSYLSVTANYGSPTTFAAPSSFLFTPVGASTNVTLNVLFAGTGSGTVTLTPPGTACNTACSEQYASGTPVNMHPEASMYSLFNSWSGGSCTGTGDCLLSPSADVAVTATFDYDITRQVMVGTTYYSSLQTAYDATPDDSIIKLWARNYTESLNCSRPITVTLQGGYDSSYASIVGDPVLNGILSITDGTVVADGLVVQ